MHSASRLKIFVSSVALSALFHVSAAQADVRLVVGFAPGATLDVTTRLIAEKLRSRLAQPVIVENKTGAGGVLANQFVKDSSADGSTLLVAPISLFTIYPHTSKKLPYDPFKDFTPVASLAKYQYGFGISASLQPTDIKQYLAQAKTDHKLGFFGSAGTGSGTHFDGLLIGKAAGISMTHVPYRGTAAVLTALQGGELAAAIVNVADIAGVANAGRARLLATLGPTRHPAFPTVPTLKESGLPVVDEGEYAVFAPANTPPAVVAKLGEAIREVLKEPEIRARFQAAYLTPTGADGKKLAAQLRDQYNLWAPIVKDAGVTIDN